MAETQSDEPWCLLDFDFSERGLVSVVPKKFGIGRHPKNELVETDERVSAYHCQILFKERAEGPAEVMDRSTYGTFINGKKIGKDRTKPVNDGDVVAVILGEPTLIFTFRDRRSTSAAPPSGGAVAPGQLRPFEAQGNAVVPNLPSPEQSVMASKFGPASVAGSASSLLSVPNPIPAVRDIQPPSLQGEAPSVRAAAHPPPLPAAAAAPRAFAESDNVLLSSLPPPEESVINLRVGGSKEGDTIGYAAC